MIKLFVLKYKRKVLKGCYKGISKRISKYTKLEIIEVKSVETNDINKNL